MIYYKSRYLANKTGVNPAKWKRWVREFLPPDPLGGMQSGFARQFSLKDAFQVYLGGHLVQTLKFGVPEARTILLDLNGWLKRMGFFELTAGNGGPNKHAKDVCHRVYIISRAAGGFSYAIRSVSSNENSNKDEITEKYSLSLIKTIEDPFVTGQATSARVIAITWLYLGFLKQISSGD